MGDRFRDKGKAVSLLLEMTRDRTLRVAPEMEAARDRVAREIS